MARLPLTLSARAIVEFLRELPLPHKSTHVSGGADEIDSPLALAAIPDSVPRNLARGITPTLVGVWDVEPTDLANVTDGDPATATGEGATSLIDYTNIVYVDLGSERLIHSIKALIGSRISNASYVAQTSCMTGADAVLWDIHGELYATTNALAEKKIVVGCEFGGSDVAPMRYVGLRFRTNNALGTAYLKIYEIVVLGVNY